MANTNTHCKTFSLVALTYALLKVALPVGLTLLTPQCCDSISRRSCRMFFIMCCKVYFRGQPIQYVPQRAAKTFFSWLPICSLTCCQFVLQRAANTFFSRLPICSLADCQYVLKCADSVFFSGLPICSSAGCQYVLQQTANMFFSGLSICS